MNIYLDIDKTIITKNYKQANHLYEFLDHFLNLGDVYWLTTHCREGSNKPVFTYLKPILDAKTFSLIQKIKPTTWSTLKTETIDFDKEFLWFDDYLLLVEQNILKEHNIFSSWIKVDLKNDPDQLLTFTSRARRHA